MGAETRGQGIRSFDKAHPLSTPTQPLSHSPFLIYLVYQTAIVRNGQGRNVPLSILQEK